MRVGRRCAEERAKVSRGEEKGEGAGECVSRSRVSMALITNGIPYVCMFILRVFELGCILNTLFLGGYRYISRREPR